MYIRPLSSDRKFTIRVKKPYSLNIGNGRVYLSPGVQLGGGRGGGKIYFYRSPNGPLTFTVPASSDWNNVDNGISESKTLSLFKSKLKIV